MGVDVPVCARPKRNPASSLRARPGQSGRNAQDERHENRVLHKEGNRRSDHQTYPDATERLNQRKRQSREEDKSGADNQAVEDAVIRQVARQHQTQSTQPSRLRRAAAHR